MHVFDTYIHKHTHKLQALKSGKSQEEMEEEFGFSALEEVHTATRGIHIYIHKHIHTYIYKHTHTLQVLKSGKSQEEMEEEFGFGALEEVHAATRGELELIKTLGKTWFDNPVDDEPAKA
jgi:hypothetical protein